MKSNNLDKDKAKPNSNKINTKPEDKPKVNTNDKQVEKATGIDPRQNNNSVK
jgi:hypothetical protein